MVVSKNFASVTPERSHLESKPGADKAQRMATDFWKLKSNVHDKPLSKRSHTQILSNNFHREGKLFKNCVHKGHLFQTTTRV